MKMILLYISKLSKNPWAGPRYSVPAQIRAQAEIDAVFWYDLNSKGIKEWEDTGCFHNLDDIPSGRLNDLPGPFNRPDLVVFEGVYSYPFAPIIRDIRRRRIPYVIIPRGSLTSLAQKRHRLKKFIGNLLFFNRFARSAAAIQYLTEQERQDSGKRWNKNSIVIPNGIDSKTDVKTEFSDIGISGVFIGRIEPYHKGLDLLVQACAEISNELRRKQVRILIYGPDWQNGKTRLQKMISEHRVSDIIKAKEAVYGEEKARVLLENDVFIMTSRFEGHPMGLIEALSYGLPCFVTRGTNMLPEIEEYDAGWVAESDAASVSAVLLEMIRDSKNFSNKAKNAIFLSKKYEWSEIAKQTQGLYKKEILNVEKQSASE